MTAEPRPELAAAHEACVRGVPETLACPESAAESEVYVPQDAGSATPGDPVALETGKIGK